jgi:hypothetical protein
MAPRAFLDVAYPDLLDDPMKQVRRIREFLELHPAPGTDAAMQRFLAANPQHKGGVHRYRLEDFGLDSDRLEQRFEPYRSRYGVVRE